MKKKQNTVKRVVALALLPAIIVSLFPMAVAESRAAEAAQAANDPVGTLESRYGTLEVLYSVNGGKYTVNMSQETGDLIIQGEYHSDSTATLSYHTSQLYFTAEHSDGNPTSVKYRSFGVSKHDMKVSDGLSYDTYVVPRETLEGYIYEFFSEEELKSGTVTIYMSEGYQLKKRSSADEPWGTPYGRVYNSLEDIRGAAEWSETTEKNFKLYFDIPLQIKLRPYSVTLDSNEGGVVYGGGSYYYGDTVVIEASPNNGYRFTGWTGVKSGIALLDGYSWEDEAVYFSMPGRNVTLTANFEKVEAPTPIPTHAPVEVTPLPTEPPDPTPTPTPLPTPTPSYPTEDKIGFVQNYRYYTTDKGYSIDTLSASAKLVDRNGGTNNAGKLLQKDAAYYVGTDATGNTWYFEPSGSNAVYVHPKVYKGHDVASSDIRYIQELTFPGKLTCDGITYTVTSIGGGLSWYGTKSYSDVKYDDSGVGGGTSYSRGKTTGYYSYQYNYAMNANFQSMVNEYLSYRLGVIGNGEISSAGGPSKYWLTTGAQWYTNYGSSYTVYNTTLAEITIPDTVTRIEDYAFANCNALVKINCADGVKEIGKCAFMAGSEATQLSYTGDNDSYCYYYYNESYTLEKPWTQVMQEYNKTRQLSEYLQLAGFPALKTIEEQAFYGRSNLYDVVLAEGISLIEKDAFLDCRLNSITLPNQTAVIEGDEATLGTKGYGTDRSKTNLITLPDSTTVHYGLSYVWYYKLRCGYEVTYTNNFTPEETYVSTSELTERFVEENISIATTNLTYNGTVTLDTDGNVWFRHSKNVIPQLLDFGTKIIGIESVDSMAKITETQYTSEGYSYPETVAKACVHAYGENGEIFYISSSAKTGDAETPYISTWEQVGTPEGATSFRWVANKTTERTSSTNGSAGNSSGAEIRETYLYYVTAKGTIEYMLQNTSSRTLSGSNYGDGYGNSWEDAADFVWASGRSMERNEVAMPEGVRFQSIFLAPEQYGGNEVTSESSSGTSYKKEYTASLSLPTIYATATDGSLWVGTAKKTSKQTLTGTYSDYYGWRYKGTCEPITVEAADYVWEKTDIRQVFGRTGDFKDFITDTTSGSEQRQSYSYFAITKTGDLLYYACQSIDTSGCTFEEQPVLCGAGFVSMQKIDGYAFLLDKEGCWWLLSKGPETAPVKLFSDAQIERVFSIITSSSGSSVASSETQLYIMDDAGRVWKAAYFFQRVYQQPGFQDYRALSAGLFMDTGSQVKKISYANVYGYNEANTMVDWSGLSMLFLCEDGSLWAYGYNSHLIKHQAHRQSDGTLITSYGYTSIIGPGGDYKTPKKVSGDIFFIDTVHKGTYSLAMDKDGKVYRTGYYYNSYTGEASPAEYDGFTLVDMAMEYTGSGSFLAGYHFSETLYDCMFERDSYTFLHWNEASDSSGTALYPGEDLVVEGPVTLYAQWEKTANKVRYHPNGGAGYMEDTVCGPTVKTVTLSKNTYTKKGYEFTGWNTKKDGTGKAYADGASFAMKTGTTVLYAQWKPFGYTLKVAEDDVRVTPVVITDTYDLIYDEEFTVPTGLRDKAYTVGYDLNKRSSMSTTPYWKTTLPLSNEYTKAQLTFLGWQLYEEREADTEYRYLNQFLLPGEVTKNLAADRNYPPVLFPYWGGDAAYVKLPTAACDGYWFIGWTDDKNETDEEKVIHAEEGSGAQYKPKADETLYGYYEPRKYDIGLIADVKDAEPGEIIHEQTMVTMTFDQMIPGVVIPESDRYVFMGYYDKLDEDGKPAEDAVRYYDENGTAALDETTGKPRTWGIYDGSVTELYAYMISEINVTLDGRGATRQEQTSVKVRYGETGAIDADGNAGGSIIPPEKTGYTFQGYYTEIRGGGTMYFDAAGKGTNVWLEKNVDILYACWEQKPVELPEQEKTEGPEVVPEKQVRIEIAPENNKVELSSDEFNVATEGIPSTESVFLHANTGAFLVSCLLERKSGVEQVKLAVTVPYRTQYETVDDETLVISELQTKTVEVMVWKAWSYWMVKEGGLYIPQTVIAENTAFNGGIVETDISWENSTEGKKQFFRIMTYGEGKERLNWPSYDENGTPVLYLTLPEEVYIISDVPGEPPEVETYITNIAMNVAGKNQSEFEVRSDCFSVGDLFILSDEIGTGHGEAPNYEAVRKLTIRLQESEPLQTRKDNIPLCITGKNGSHKTKASVLYKACEGTVGECTERRVAVEDTNDILLHTPVLCEAVLTAEHETSYQCEAVPEDAKVVVLEKEEGKADFVLQINNFGEHSGKKGYGLQSYSKYLAESDGKVRNEVRFPVTVWVDIGNDKEQANDVLLEAGTWYCVGTAEQRFYLPVGTVEGVYTIVIRSVAVNGEEALEETEAFRNKSIEKYVATDKVKVYVTGRLYEFTVYDVKGGLAWDKKKSRQYYSVGTSEETEEALWKTLPLRKGVHPEYWNAGGLPAGGSFSFRVRSVGSFSTEETRLILRPELVRLGENGYEPVDAYFEKETGEGIFLTKWSAAEAEMVLTAAEDSFAAENEEAVRNWYGHFLLPESLYVAEAGTEVLAYQKKYGLSFTESFWIQKEPLVLRFSFCIMNGKGEKLYYGTIPEKIANNIWCMEAGVSERSDTRGRRYPICGGEVAVLYPGESSDNEYGILGIY